MTVYTTIDSPLGELLLVGEESATAKGGTALASLSVPGQKIRRRRPGRLGRGRGRVRGDRLASCAPTSTAG